MATILLCAIFLSGCSAIEGAQKFMAEMTAVQSAVVSLTGHKDTRVVHLNEHILQVVLVTSKYNEIENEAKVSVMVVFYIHEKKMGIMEYNNSLDSHTFSISQVTVEATATLEG